ncbi:zf-TFIIB domain-containing protein [Niveibacterium terrae]|uniref:TFIIB-type zinc ribbon-containing protein n=1 Tax=Niveibacterium terrae TaxID=3373598 RepID=UPI003A941B71
MLCPACKTIELAMTERQGIEIDYCPSCRGVWLDRGELDKIIERTLLSERPPSTAPSPYQSKSRNPGGAATTNVVAMSMATMSMVAGTTNTAALRSGEICSIEVTRTPHPGQSQRHGTIPSNSV